MKYKHVLGISGGKDSAALAIFMRDNYPELDIEYFFTDTGKELPEVYEYLSKLEGYLGKTILRINPDRDFDFWLMQHNNYLPSAQARWCTIKMKLKPFEDWVKTFLLEGYEVFSYVAIRSDEEYREGYQSKNKNLHIKLPFREHGVDKQNVLEILEQTGLGLPEYYKWRSRSGCTFCFFQRKIEWVGLLENHPEAFEEAKAYEKTAVKNGTPFTWSERESLEELAQPVRIRQIKEDHQRRVERLESNQIANALRPNENLDIDELYGNTKSCLICHK
ncbi:phosphoadenosine phosphosulfate reductase family protein [Acinetobacter baumannii]|uniref:Phosphoadenosine phosphosulphate reductase domain-containing protein n=1 Tax=Acinetobacter baumannii TaxID=470 RepID=A0AB37A7V7_ACIBA|nr:MULTISPECIES: phosphoadenosine phosphosulfate reductase family protein [Acinetobacter]EKX2702368.1 phosphoadenosine phosphosulfate reductase family protein [Acinetobacter baumannii]EKY1320201.1 phosphoadenosine phosphosulfate reductase family protein [Acinetobacter baumannii]EKY1522147.1 phosphoadenosine phosphosulfate reductase family protein [Acinetobacter baumannii]MBE2425639.1 phosphoadenosine phosphosulfate reductase family protein [Acinetobacter baumannii]MBE2489921.1 phosphoadenosine